jgi:hypothetical protein
MTGSGGLSVANQIHDRFKAAGKPLSEGDVAIVDGAEHHYYQVCLFCYYHPYFIFTKLELICSLDGLRFIESHVIRRLISVTGLSWGLDYGQRVISVARLLRKSPNILRMYQKTSNFFHRRPLP